MPSFFSKLSSLSKRKNNPYMNPHHQGHAPMPQPTSKPATRSQSVLPTRPASPREAYDLLAEARQVANGDPVTGRLLSHPTTVSQTASKTNPQVNTRLNGALNAVDRLEPSAERSAYLNRASQSTHTMGTKYELFAREERQRREEEENLTGAKSRVEYYAPERSLSEFYAGGVRD